MCKEMIGTGTCSYCGQQRMVTCREFATASELNQSATLDCCCEKALEARSLEYIPERINDLFGNGCKEYGFEHECSGEALNALLHAAVAVVEDKLQEAKIKLQCGDMAVIKLGAYDMLEISREMKRKRTV